MIFRIDRQTLHGMLALLTLLLLAGCADSGSGDEPVLARLSIEGDSLMFTETGVTRSLQARGYDNNGNAMDVAVTWQSSRSDQVHIDASSGVVTSIANGAAVITATADGVESNPLTAVVTTLQRGVQAISDAEIIQGPIAAANAPDTYGVGYPFSVILDPSIGLPQVGDLLAANGDIPFAGRVTAISQDTQGNHLVTLEIVAINEIFADFNMDEEINLAHAPVTINPQLEEYFVVDQNASGEVLLTPRQQSLRTYAVPESAAGKAAKPLGTAANPYYPYKCSYSPDSASALLPIKIDLGNQTTTIKQDLSLPLIISPTRGVEKAALRGEISLSRKFKFAVTAAFEAKVTCMMEVYQIDIPLPGALGFLVGVQVPIGIGGELSAKIKVADVGVEPEVVVKATAEAGYYNPPACDSAPAPDPVPAPGTTDRPAVSNSAARTANKVDVCGFDISFNLDTDFKLNLDRPTTGTSLETLANDVTIEPKAMVFGYAILGLGNKYFSALSTEFLELRVGPYLSANLATANGQVVNDGYKSSYGLGGEGVLMPGSTVVEALKLLGGTLSVPTVQIKLDQPWSTSPTAKSVTLTGNNSNYLQGDVLSFNVELDETTVDPFPIPGLFYNVADILIYKKAPANSGEAAKLIASASANEGQLKFTLDWIADAKGDATDQFFAFVSTKLLPSLQIGVLELDKVKVASTEPGKLYYQVGDTSAFVESYDFASKITQRESSIETSYARHPVVLPGQNILAYTGKVYGYPDFVRGVYLQIGIGSSPGLLAQDAWNFSISPGSSKIVYEIADTLYMGNLDGTGELAITSDSLVNDYPAISPDGNLLAYAAFNDIGDQSHIELMDLNTLAIVNTNVSKNAGGATYRPAWSPDSKFIAYELEDTVQIVEVDTGAITQLNTTTQYRSAPTWSPDGKKIAFAYGGDIYTVNLDGTGRTNITNTPGRGESNPAWSN